MPIVQLKGYIEFEEHELADVLKELPNHIALTRQETGCLKFEVEQDKINKRKFRVLEEFTSPSAFDHHQSRVQNSKWGLISQKALRKYQISEK